MQIFKIIDKCDLVDLFNIEVNPGTKEEALMNRLWVKLKLLHKENPFLPYGFKFRGEFLTKILIEKKKRIKELRLK